MTRFTVREKDETECGTEKMQGVSGERVWPIYSPFLQTVRSVGSHTKAVSRISEKPQVLFLDREVDYDQIYAV